MTKCLAQGHNTVPTLTPKPLTPPSQVKRMKKTANEPGKTGFFFNYLCLLGSCLSNLYKYNEFEFLFGKTVLLQQKHSGEMGLWEENFGEIRCQLEHSVSHFGNFCTL